MGNRYGYTLSGDKLHSFGGNLLTSGQITQQIASHAVVGGVAAELAGGKFGHGFFSAGVTKGLGGAFLPSGSNLSTGEVVEGTVVSAVIGGTASAISGGKFANGAQTAAFQYMFNQASSFWEQTKKSFGILGREISNEFRATKEDFKAWAVSVDLSKGLANGARAAGWAASAFVVIPGGQPIAAGFAGASLALGAGSVAVDYYTSGNLNEAAAAGSAHAFAVDRVQNALVPALPLPYRVPAVIGFDAYDRVTSEMFGLASSE